MTEAAVEAVIVAPCTICGVGIPMRVSEYKEMVALGAPVIHREHVTANDAPVLKFYKAVVQVFEVAVDGSEELVAATTVKAHAPTLHAAFNGPLSEELQEKWLAMGEKSMIADSPGD